MMSQSYASQNNDVNPMHGDASFTMVSFRPHYTETSYCTKSLLQSILICFMQPFFHIYRCKQTDAYKNTVSKINKIKTLRFILTTATIVLYACLLESLV